MFWDSIGLFSFYKGIFTCCLQIPYKTNSGILLISYTFRYFQKIASFDVNKKYYLCHTCYYYFQATLWIYGGTRNWTIRWHSSITSLVILLSFVIPVTLSNPLFSVIFSNLPICRTLSSTMLLYFLTLALQSKEIISVN